MTRRPPAARPHVEPLEDRAVPAGGSRLPGPPVGGLAVGYAAENRPTAGPFYIRVYQDATTYREFEAYPPLPNSLGGTTSVTHVATGDVTGDGVADVVTAPGPVYASFGVVRPAEPVKVFDGASFKPVHTFHPFGANHPGGIFVACGDFDRDGRADVVASRDGGGTARVKVYSGADVARRSTAEPVADFDAVEDPGIGGGCHVAVGPLNADGVPDLVAGAVEASRVAGWDGSTLRPGAVPRKLFNDFYALVDPVTNSPQGVAVHVAAGDFDGDGYGEVVAGEREESLPRGVVFDGRDLVTTFGAARTAWWQEVIRFGSGAYGVRPVARDLNGDGRPELVVSNGGTPAVGITWHKDVVAGTLSQDPPRSLRRLTGTTFDPLVPLQLSGVWVG